MRFMKLDLRSPLYFENPFPAAPDHANPATNPVTFMKDFFESAKELDECLAVFELDPEVAVSLSPDPTDYLRFPTAVGVSAPTQALSARNGSSGGSITMPPDPAKVGTGLALSAGLYLFVQVAGPTSLDQLAAEAIELQKEGVWNGESLGSVLYLRVLLEEQGLVHQLLRPVSGKNRGA